MTDYLEEYLQEPAPPVIDEYRTLQRNALQEVIKLSSETVAPAVAQIESLYTKEQKIVEGRFEETKKEIESRFQIQSEETRQAYNNRLIEIETAYKAERKRLESIAKAGQNTIISKAEGKLQKVKRKCQEDILLAETERDATIQNAHRERQHIEKAVPAGKERLDEMSERAEQFLELYRCPERHIARCS